MKLLRRLLVQAKKKTPKLQRAQEKFHLRYPSYSIGNGTYGMPEVYDWQEGSTLKVGAYCSIASNVQIFLGGLHRTDWITTFPFPAFIDEAADITDYNGSRGDVVIGNDVWLCSNCVILSGVTVGHGAVVACGSIVTRDVAPYSVVAGNPARHVRWRFPEEQRRVLLGIEWWNWPEADIRAASTLLCSSDVDALRAHATERSAKQQTP
ncbi:CatB-related O-acetyltransferase [Stutzerimonas xanthomarina]|uniref:Acetyltransferase (Isoleucine patch superfamily) n=2 Tax=Stutzerimonas xanthomarina TaxID=271420 RepID=A0A1M5KNF3_9GAMM|nr:CatB-related O-acetyltransferase [Stutzerimonas xanthomarina]MCP9337212.1 CatB-related O-acetyltransferase [Stutzerimonas xanthomarina]SEI07379.1 Acetyltransferase (isoleucine patch superfamily) [Stutzerimonas xanthomarina]SHG54230.1 Acetyltransferase (isoleucine patch superfamily) [Stutzerimonas xanthomarina DSM 18231]